jgi:CRISPR system Cascade subunit CasE
MYFSRVELCHDLSTASLIGQLMSGNIYAAHQLLWKLFPSDPDAERDFLFRQEVGGGWPIFYLISRRKPQTVDIFSEVACKEYKPVLRVGEQLAFTLRANPVVARKTEGRKHSVRHDVWMDAKRVGGAQGLEGIKLQSFIEEQVKKWLLLQGKKKGFSALTEDVELQRYQQHRVYKKKIGQPIRYSSIDFQGVITIDDPASMQKVLFDGIGKAKGFGCGLMLVRRV